MTKQNSGKASVLALLGTLALSSTLLVNSMTKSVYATQTPTCGTYTYEFNNEGSNFAVNVNVHNSDEQVDVTGLSGWTVSNLWLDQDGGGTNYVSFGSGNKLNYNPSNFGDIDRVKVEVTKTCPSTPTPTPTPQHIEVTICHATHSDGNPFNKITVDDDAVDGNGNGNADHNRNDHQDGEDIIPPGSWDADGRNWNATNIAIYNNNCNIPAQTATPSPTATPTATPSPTASPTATATATPVATATPSPTATATPVETSTPLATSTPVETATPVATATPESRQTPDPTATPLVCSGTQHLNADGSKCVDFELGGPPQSPEVLGIGGGGQVLGASTMAGTGSFAENLYLAIMTLGGTLTAKAAAKIRKAFKKAN